METEMLCNPFDMKDMEKAVSRIDKALKSNEKITVYGDYDVDGVTSVCTLYLYLKSLGARVEYYIPNRNGEGYGVSNSAIESIKASGTSLIITVDTGVTANDEILFAKSIGVDFLVTDHHECREELPEAEAVINPHRPDCQYPFKELAGVGVVFKLICAHYEHKTGKSRYEATLEMMRKYADLVAVGTIADVMPIKEENRIIVSYGLNLMENSCRTGLSALIDAIVGSVDVKRGDQVFVKKPRTPKITSSYIGFTIAPRLNAAGRIRSASMAVELFLEKDYKKALAIAEELCLANKERQAEENKIMKEAYGKIESLNIDDNPVIVLDSNDWHHGVIGIVSSRITEKYSRPSILVSFDGNTPGEIKNDDVGKGSGRSIKGMNLVDALLYCSDYLVKYGGHELAAGLSVTRENLPVFVEKINEYAKNTLTEENMIHTVEADCMIDFGDINLALAESLRKLEPYGVGNPVPMFIMKNVNLIELSGVSDGKHSRLTIGDGRTNLTAMYFSNPPSSLGVIAGDKIDILFSIDVNEWKDRKSVQLIVRDLKPQESFSDLSMRERYERIRRGESFKAEDGILPSREDFVYTYKYILQAQHNGITEFTHNDLVNKLSFGFDSREIGYIKLKFIILIFKELNLVNIEDIDTDKYRFTIHYSTTKKDLEKSNILKKLRSQIR
jgi:single-stranded-DNA-specific exonuclease